MDNYSTRTPRPTRPPVQLVTQQTQQVDATSQLRKKRRPHIPRAVFISAGSLVGLLALIIGGLWVSHLDIFTGIESNHYQMVYLTNGQYYFGKLAYTLSGQAVLTDIYYIKDTSKTAADQQGSQQPIELVKLGKELHSPRDAMMIGPNQLLYFENLNDDGQVVKTILSDKNK